MAAMLKSQHSTVFNRRLLVSFKYSTPFRLNSRLNLKLYNYPKNADVYRLRCTHIGSGYVNKISCGMINAKLVIRPYTRGSAQVDQFFNAGAVNKDTLVYSYKNNTYVKILPYFGILHFALMAYFSYFIYGNLRDTSKAPNDAPVTGWKRFNLGNKNFKTGFIVFVLSLGQAVLLFSIFYPLRSVSSIILLRGGNHVRLTTYAPFGKHRVVKVPLSQLSCLRSRQDYGTSIIVKIKGLLFYFVIDKSGTFHNLLLFDYHVALTRSLKK